MTQHHQNRRDFLKTAAAAGAMSYWVAGTPARASFQAPGQRPVIGCIGTGDRWKAVGPAAMKFGDVAAICDVDGRHLGEGKEIVLKKQGTARQVDRYEDYRKVLDRKDIDLVTIVTPDHWHTKIAIEAMKAGKDVYCEKPLTLTIDEGKLIRKVLQETGRVFQVGTQQRSEMGLTFLKAIALVKAGRIGEVKRVQCAIGTCPTSPSLPAVDPPKELNWEMWQGQAPVAKYRYLESGDKRAFTRCHYEFRWWYEYSGGKMTDWGAHHVDIAQWAIGMDNSGPVWVEGTAEHPVPLVNGRPTDDTMYNTANKFLISLKFPNGVDMTIRHDTDNGVLIDGTEGRIFVSRGKVAGQPVDDMKTNPLPEDALVKLYKGKEPGDHMRNFIQCVQTREQPISDVFTHHRAMTTCHLANIAIRLGRRINWDPEKEEIVGDPEAKQWQAREQRKGYEIVG